MSSAEKSILILNGGSSSIKFAVFAVEPALRLTIKGQIERIGASDGVFSTQQGEHQAHIKRQVGAVDYAGAVELLIAWIDEINMDGPLIAVGHSIVHGGPNFHAPQRLTPTVTAASVLLKPVPICATCCRLKRKTRGRQRQSHCFVIRSKNVSVLTLPHWVA